MRYQLPHVVVVTARARYFHAVNAYYRLTLEKCLRDEWYKFHECDMADCHLPLIKANVSSVSARDACQVKY